MNIGLLPSTTRMAGVDLDVADVDAMTAFYRDVLLLEVLADRGSEVDLGRGGATLVTLRHRPDLPRGERRSAGLFHTALLHGSQASLARTLASVATSRPDLYTGSGDHLVSQAFYLDDPEGNGVELYWDRPRDQWRWVEDRVVMDTLFIDPNEFVASHLTAADRDFVHTAADIRGRLGEAAEVVGHVHLKVGRTDAAKAFYVDTLGFETTAELPGALFVSAGKYHHHMAMNTWQSQGVGLRAPALGLGRVDIRVDTDDAVTAAAERLRAGGVRVRDTGAAVEADDPWGNLIRIAVA